MYKFGSREVCDVVFKAKSTMQIGALTAKKGQPVLYIDTATASTLEQATTTVYAQGGKGNTRLITWEGEKTLTFTVTDALLSPVGIAILTGAGIIGGQEKYEDQYVHVHATASADVDNGTTIKIANSAIDPTAPVFVLDYENDVIGSMIGTDDATITYDWFASNGTATYKGAGVTAANVPKLGATSLTAVNGTEAKSNITALTSVVITQSIITLANATESEKVFVDYYEMHKKSKVSEIQIDQDVFSGNFYVEGSTLFRTQDGADLPAEITIPNAKIQSNITLSFSSSGDPSTFDFTMEAMPGYTYFDNTKKVMCVIQVVEDAAGGTEATFDSVMKHDTANTVLASNTVSGSLDSDATEDSVNTNDKLTTSDIAKG